MVKEITNVNEFDELIKNGFSFVDFYANWCYPCKMMMPIVEEIEKELEGEINFYKVDVDNNNDLAIRYRVSSIPRFMIFKDSKLVKMLVGAMEKEELLKVIRECMIQS